MQTRRELIKMLAVLAVPRALRSARELSCDVAVIGASVGGCAACKNIGATHITNGCYRPHPVEWNICAKNFSAGSSRRAWKSPGRN